jgi:multiple sugar transport system ATP-binding protein
MNFLSGEIIPFVKDKNITVGIRPEDLKLSSREMPDSLKGKSSVTESLGSDNYLYVEVSDTLVSVRLKPEEKVGEGEEVWLAFDSKRIHKFDKNTGKRI